MRLKKFLKVTTNINILHPCYQIIFQNKQILESPTFYEISIKYQSQQTIQVLEQDNSFNATNPTILKIVELNSLKCYMGS